MAVAATAAAVKAAAARAAEAMGVAGMVEVTVEGGGRRWRWWRR